MNEEANSVRFNHNGLITAHSEPSDNRLVANCILFRRFVVRVNYSLFLQRFSIYWSWSFTHCLLVCKNCIFELQQLILAFSFLRCSNISVIRASFSHVLEQKTGRAFTPVPRLIPLARCRQSHSYSSPILKGMLPSARCGANAYLDELLYGWRVLLRSEKIYYKCNVPEKRKRKVRWRSVSGARMVWSIHVHSAQRRDFGWHENLTPQDFGNREGQGRHSRFCVSWCFVRRRS